MAWAQSRSSKSAAGGTMMQKAVLFGLLCLMALPGLCFDRVVVIEEAYSEG